MPACLKRLNCQLIAKPSYLICFSAAVPELDVWLGKCLDNAEIALMIRALVGLAGDASVLDRAREVFAEAPAEVELALDELQAVVSALSESFPDLELYLDLSELRGYHYHTGIVFAAYDQGLGQAIGNGGRYDHVGKGFGRSRPATGFNMSLQSLARVALSGLWQVVFLPLLVRSPVGEKAVAALRSNGERVVCGFSGPRAGLSGITL